MNNIYISKPSITDVEKKAVMDVLDSGFLAQGSRTAEFEKRFASMLDVKHAIAVSNGTCAIQIALLAEGIGPGDEVITSPFTFIATANAIVYTGAKPVFVDIDLQSFNLSPELIESAITPRTKAILPVHLYGQVCDMDQIEAIAKKYNLKIIEDACQSVLATYKGKHAGSFGSGTFSFYATKNMMTGEGGMITTNDDEVAENCRLIRNHGMKERYVHQMVGFNFRMTDIQAAIGCAQIERVQAFTEKRRANAAYYNENIHSVVTPVELEDREHVWHQYTVRIENNHRDAAMDKLSKAGIGFGIYYPIPLHKQQSMEKYIDNLNFPVTEQASNEVLSLPVHPGLSDEDLERVVEEVNKI
jgi:dTDP-4-amino-4,6-dideoxygalactose transaminase